MCHILCFLTGAGLATYLARKRHDRLYDDDDDVYYGDRMRERSAAAAAAPSGNAYHDGNADHDAAAPRAFEQGDRKQQQEARGTGERGRFRKSVRTRITFPPPPSFLSFVFLDGMEGKGREWVGMLYVYVYVYVCLRVWYVALESDETAG